MGLDPEQEGVGYLVPLYLKFKLAGDDFYKGIKVLFTIHNMAYQGIFDRSVMDKAAIPGEFFKSDGLEFYG